MTDQKSASTPFSADGEVPGYTSPDKPTDFTASVTSTRARSRPNDYVQTPAMPGSSDAGGIRDFIAEGNVAQQAAGEPDDTQADEKPPTGDRFTADSFDPSARGTGSIGNEARPFRGLK